MMTASDILPLPARMFSGKERHLAGSAENFRYMKRKKYELRQ